MQNSSQIFFFALGIAFIRVAALIVRKQRTAATCKLHSRNAGRVAIALASFSGIVGLVLVAISLLLLMNDR